MKPTCSAGTDLCCLAESQNAPLAPCVPKILPTSLQLKLYMSRQCVGMHNVHRNDGSTRVSAVSLLEQSILKGSSANSWGGACSVGGTHRTWAYMKPVPLGSVQNTLCTRPTIPSFPPAHHAYKRTSLPHQRFTTATSA